MNDQHAGGETRGAVDKALSVLEALVEGAPRSTLAAIAAKSGLTKPNTHAVLKILVRRAYARTPGDGMYEPGAQILALAGHILGTLDYAGHARPALLALQDRLPETVHFGVLSGADVFYVEKLEARRAYRMASTVGMRLLLHCTAIGKVVLAELPTYERSALLTVQGMSARTSHTMTDRDVLDAELAEVERLGFAIDNEENEEGVRCIGAPVFGALGRVIGGISVSAPSFQLPEAEARASAPLVIDTAVEVSRSLGAPQPIIDAYRQRATSDRGRADVVAGN